MVSDAKLVEDALGRFIVSMHAAAQVLISEREAREIEQRKREAALRERRRAEREAAYQKWLSSELVRQAEAHQQASVVRAFIAEIERVAPGSDPERLESWLEWARLEADRIDPLKSDVDVAQPLKPPDDWQLPGDNDRSPSWARMDPYRGS